MSIDTNWFVLLLFEIDHRSFSSSIGIYGLTESHQIPNIPCDRSLNDVFLNQHLQWYHNFDSVSSRKLVRAICNHVHPNQLVFGSHETVLKQNVAVENYKCTSEARTADKAFALC